MLKRLLMQLNESCIDELQERKKHNKERYANDPESKESYEKAQWLEKRATEQTYKN